MRSLRICIILGVCLPMSTEILQGFSPVNLEETIHTVETTITAQHYLGDNDCLYQDEYCEGKRIYKNGNIYEGEFSYGLPHGKGTFIWAEGSKYTGEFVHGLRHGWGVQELDDGSTYEGEWKDGYMEGKGKYVFACGHEYSGDFDKDQMHGNGTLIYETGESYAGHWKSGVPHGEGSHTYSDGSRFVGTFKKGNRHGEGMLVWETGEIFTANWKNDKVQNSGTLQFNNGDEYVFDFKKGRATSNSIYVRKDGLEIKGDVELVDVMTSNEDPELVAEIEPNLGFASYMLAVEYKAIEEYGLAADNFKMAQSYLPNESRLTQMIPQQLASLEDQKLNSN